MIEAQVGQARMATKSLKAHFWTVGLSGIAVVAVRSFVFDYKYGVQLGPQYWGTVLISFGAVVVLVAVVGQILALAAKGRPTVKPISRIFDVYTIDFDIGTVPPEVELTAIFQEKPNVFLYIAEAFQMTLAMMLCLSVAIMIVLYILRGAPILFLLELTSILDVVLFGIFTLVMLPGVLTTDFIVTEQAAIVRLSALGIVNRSFVIPIEEIEEIQVRTYGPRYGSVYLKRGNPRTIARVIRSTAAPWKSLTWSSLPLVGFFGFRDCNAFVDTILELKAAQQRRLAPNAV